ncbi:MAG: hypothetical protein ACQEQF_09825 [Bacillota bacterium]
MTEAEKKKYAKKLIKKMWGSSVSYSDEDLTPELCDWVIGIYLSLQNAHKEIKPLKNFVGVGPWTSIKSAFWKVIKFLRQVFRNEVDDDWGLGVRVKCKQFRREFQRAVSTGDTSILSEPKIKASKK